MIVAALALSICALLFSATTAVFSFIAYSRVVGLEKSTHRVEYVPLDGPEARPPTKKKEPLEEEFQAPERPANYPNY